METTEVPSTAKPSEDRDDLRYDPSGHRDPLDRTLAKILPRHGMDTKVPGLSTEFDDLLATVFLHGTWPRFVKKNKQ